MNKTIDNKTSKLEEAFARIAFAEEDGLRPANPYEEESLSDELADIAFAEEGAPLPHEVRRVRSPLCVNGETPGGLCA